MKIILIILSIFTSTLVFSQQESKSHSENHSIQIKYSITFEKEQFPEICKIISSEYPEFDCGSEKNPKIIMESEEEYLRIEINRKKRIKMVLKTTNPKNGNIEKFRELEKRLDKY